MTCVEGDLRKVVFNGKNEIIFKVPNFCITDPVFDRDYNKIKKNEENIEQKNIIIIICYVDDKNEKQEKKIENITNKTMVIDVKKKFAEMMEINLEKNKIRFFYKGFELLDENLLWYDNLENMAKIQCLIHNNEEE
jgi:tryptophanyl-tRNA synthetase